MVSKPVVGGNRFALSRNLNPTFIDVNALKPIGRETRKHPPAQLRKLGKSLEEFGFVLPILVDREDRVIAGWGLALAAKKLGLMEVPVVLIGDLDDGKLRSLRLALNRLSEDSSWDFDALALEFADIAEIDVDLDLTISGFEMGEIDVAFARSGNDEEDELPIASDAPAVTKPGDLWILGEHLILCGDALIEGSYERVLGEERAQMVFTDPPWNVAIANNVSGLGRVKHVDFAMACGEMSPAEFGAFLQTSLGYAVAHTCDGSIHFVCMGWSKMRELLAATASLYSELKNLCIWTKPNAGMGGFYRSAHELVFVFKKGDAPHINNIQLGKNGRNRSNVWGYPSQNVLNASAKSKLALHPTPKPVGLVADAIRDCSNRGDVILDPFGGVGSTLIAAERTGRKARLIELEPRYVDAAVRRWVTITGGAVRHAVSGLPFGAATGSTQASVGPKRSANPDALKIVEGAKGARR